MYAHRAFLQYNVIVYNKILLAALFWVQKKSGLQFWNKASNLFRTYYLMFKYFPLSLSLSQKKHNLFFMFKVGPFSLWLFLSTPLAKAFWLSVQFFSFVDDVINK